MTSDPSMSIHSVLKLTLSILLAVVAVSVVRLVWILPAFRLQPPPSRKSSAKILVVLGSGGHTAEMLRMIEHLDFNKYNRRVYVVSSGDTLSEGKVRTFEARKQSSKEQNVQLPASVVDYSHSKWSKFQGLEGSVNHGSPPHSPQFKVSLEVLKQCYQNRFLMLYPLSTYSWKLT